MNFAVVYSFGQVLTQPGTDDISTHYIHMITIPPTIGGNGRLHFERPLAQVAGGYLVFQFLP
jgi:hypothetical protein